MNIYQKGQAQFELFPGTAGSGQEPSKFPSLYKNLTLSLENIIFLAIVMIMGLALSFSFGVERGKKINYSEVIPAVKVKEVPQALPAAVSGKTLLPQQKDQRQVIKEPAPGAVPKALKTPEKNPVIRPTSIPSSYTIQVASYEKQTRAQEEVSKLNKGGTGQSFTLSKGKYIIVCVGKFAGKEEAQSFSRQLKNRYKDLIVRRL